MKEHPRSSLTMSSSPRQESGAHAHHSSRYTLMMLSELVASIGHIPPRHVGVDGFPELDIDPLHATQHILSNYLAWMTAQDESGQASKTDRDRFADSCEAHDLLHGTDTQRGDAICACLTRLRWIATQTHFMREERSGALILLLERVLSRSISYRREALIDALYHVGAMEHLCGHEFPWSPFLRSVEEHLGSSSLGSGELQALAALRAGELLKRRTLIDRDRHLLRLEKMVAGCQEMHVELGAVWSDAMHHELESLDDAQRAEWDALLAHIVHVPTKPSQRWIKRTRALIERVGKPHVVGALLRWLPGFGRRATLDFTGCPKHDPMSSVPSERNEDMLRGLAFMSALLGGETLSAQIADMALASYHKVPGHGPRSARLGNACIWALGHMPEMACLGQLWRLRQKISYATAERQIEQMIQEASERFMISMEDLEELAVPTFGLDRQGHLIEEVDDWRFELDLDASRQIHTRWVRQSVNGQAQLFALLQDEEVSHTLPRTLMREQPTQSARMEALPREIEKMIQAQSDRLETMYWSERTWSYDLWAERYLEHPLLRVICEDLIWRMRFPDGRHIDVMPHRGQFIDSEGARHDEASLRGAAVSLWHPVCASESEVARWRLFLHERRITQPFKQAHRELFDMDREQDLESGVLSLPGYVLKQHQFIALCKTRGWKAKLQGSWQTPKMPELVLGTSPDAPHAQLWVSVVSAPSLMTRAGAFIYVVMDQVVFTREDGTLCGLDEVGKVAYSELWRDLELFVSVAGVSHAHADEVLRGALAQRGMDRMPELQMSGAARVRGEVLEALLERTHWGQACTLDKTCLWVTDPGGTRRRIELDSGLVRDASGELLESSAWSAEESQHHLEQEVSVPFEGDGLLWTILRKARHMATHTPHTRLAAGG